MQAGAQTSDSVTAIVLHPRFKRSPVVREIADLLHHPTFAETQHQLHHSGRKSDHLLRSARYAYWLGRMVKADRRVCARAGLLHDLYSRLGTWATHGAIAASVAHQMGESVDVCRAIVGHMYPVGPAPRTKEGWVIAVADKIASVVDGVVFVGRVIQGDGQKQRKALLARDRFLAARIRKAA